MDLCDKHRDDAETQQNFFQSIRLMLHEGVLDKIILLVYGLTMRNLAIIVGMCALALMVLGNGLAYAGAKCKCRFNGGYIEEGQTACIKTPTGMSLARCEKVLNNTSWKTLNKPCPFALNDWPSNPLQTPFPAASISSS